MIRWTILLLLNTALMLNAQPEPPPRSGGSRQPLQTSKWNDVPAHPFDLVLGRPTARSVTVSVLCFEDGEGFIAYGRTAGKLSEHTPKRRFTKGEVVEMLLSGLEPDSRYFYQFQFAGNSGTELSFHTARPSGAAFTFTVTADSHLDEHSDAAVYQRTLANALADKPDFHIDLGDTFMSEKHPDREAAGKQYLAQRYYFGQLCNSAPLFLVLGNHDGERAGGNAPDSLAVWSNLTRKRYFPNPVPDDFYTGNSTKHPQAGWLQDYYAWEWGDALFVVLDPFWFTQPQRGKGDNWSRTLGTEQYQWLKRSLEKSRAKFKFVFIHHLVGGKDNQSRGGMEIAPLYEWGGHDADGSDGFKQNRPGWAAPIHQLFVENKVSVVFHGHDHLYAKQDLDGIVYQEVPQPGYPGNGRAPRSAAEYGYVHGTILGSSGHMRITVSADKTRVEYVSCRLPVEKSGGSENGRIADSYVIAAP